MILRSLLGSPVLARAAASVWALLPAGLRRLALRHYPRPAFRVGVLAIVVPPDGGVLLLRHRFRAGRPWGLPGGWLEPGEAPVDGLRRELGEELGLAVQPRELELVTVSSPEGNAVNFPLLALSRASCKLTVFGAMKSVCSPGPLDMKSSGSPSSPEPSCTAGWPANWISVAVAPSSLAAAALAASTSLVFDSGFES